MKSDPTTTISHQSETERRGSELRPDAQEGALQRREVNRAYMDRSSGPGRRGTKRGAAVAIGTAVVERIVRGRYEQDGGRDRGGRRR